MIDVKKLVTGFLILAAIISSSALILPNFFASEPALPPGEISLANLTLPDGNKISSVPANAFVEPLPDNKIQIAGALSLGDDGLPLVAPTATPDPGNLTQNLANKFAKQVIENNPNGPQLDESNNPTVLNLPTAPAMEQLISKTVTETGTNFNFKTSPQPARLIENYTDTDVARYFDTVTGSMLSLQASMKLGSPAPASILPEKISIAALAADQELQNLGQLPTPAPFKEIQEALLAGLAGQKNALDTMNNYQEKDPVRAVIAAQSAKTAIINARQKLSAAFKKPISLKGWPAYSAKNFSKQLHQIALGTGIAENPTPLTASGSTQLTASGELATVFNYVFGIETAHAYIVEETTSIPRLIEATFDTIENTLDLVQYYLEWFYKLGLRVVINNLLNTFQSQVVNWIKGGGKPLFITNWKGFLRSTYNVAAGVIIGQLVPNLCRNLGPLVRTNLQNSYTRNINGYLGGTCSLDQIVANVNNFYRSFENGGWIAYGATSLPGGNYYGTVFLAQQHVGKQAQDNANAKHNEGIASLGFLSQKQCPNNPDGTIMDLVDDLCYPNDDTSPPIDPILATPGSAVATSLFHSLNWKPQQVIGAVTLADVVSGILEASLGVLMQKTILGSP